MPGFSLKGRFGFYNSARPRRILYLRYKAALCCLIPNAYFCNFGVANEANETYLNWCVFQFVLHYDTSSSLVLSLSFLVSDHDNWDVMYKMHMSLCAIRPSLLR